MGQPEVIYVVDTSSWLRIKGHPESYRILDRSGQLVERGAISDPREVFEELKELSDAVSCVKQNKEGSVRRQMTDVEYLLAAGQVQYAFPAMGGATSGKNKADPYVVALGKFMLNAGTKCVVVANENYSLPTEQEDSCSLRALRIGILRSYRHVESGVP